MILLVLLPHKTTIANWAYVKNQISSISESVEFKSRFLLLFHLYMFLASYYCHYRHIGLMWKTKVFGYCSCRKLRTYLRTYALYGTRAYRLDDSIR